ncbi:amino acid adenylation domain-containing protein [Streptomyces sp. NPDC060209]|uniref:amino acid adenylation domain-containing protein n=1 Tax=Streptomyces sp. NPDC060209 TaxID=3347073 RepID=UPI00365CF0E3
MNSLPEPVLDTLWNRPTWAGHAPDLPAAATASDPVASLPADAVLHRAFVEQAGRTPEALAVVAADRTLTYGELAAESARVAAQLTSRGLGRASRVAVVMEKGWEQAVACLGILRAGAAYVPVDPGWPTRRVADVLVSAGVTEALTQPRTAGGVVWPEGVGVTAIEASGGDDAPPSAVRDVEVGPGDLAYVIYTSGSTGVPKGVMIEHGPAVNTVQDVNDTLGCTAEDRVLALSALNFDLSVYDLFGPLSVGGAVVIPAPDDAREPADWLRLMAEWGVTVWNSVPALMAMLTEYAGSAPAADLPASPLRAVLMSGDWIPVSLPGEVRALFPGARQWSLGGATEASIWSILHPITPQDSELPSIPYGRAMRNQHVYVGDGLMLPRPCWVPGEILIAGAGLARGYLGDPERTARSFPTDPATGARRYRTGDWGRLLPSGEIEFLGREDMQVKVGGHRIELGDIEAAMLACPGVRGAVAGTHGERNRARLTAQVLLEPGAGLAAADLKRLLTERVPAYMVPTTVTVRESFPLTVNGKVDRAALAALAEDTAVEQQMEAPADLEEKLLLGIWQDFFAVQQESAELSVTDNFFELGGDSLGAVRLMSVLRRETGVRLPVSVLFGAPTVRDLARRLRTAREETGEDRGRAVVVPVRTTGEAVPLVFAHPVGGDVLCYVELSRALGEEQPFYALQSPDHDGAAPTLGELVHGYADALVREVASDRYRLGGWSMGGVLALELARELIARGHTVDLVAAVDVLETPEGLARAEISRDRLLGRLARDLAGLTGTEWPGDPGPFDSLPELYEAARAAGILPADIALTEFAAIDARFQANARALYGYRPGAPLQGPRVHFLQAEGGGGPEAAEGWRPLCDGEFTQEVVPGDHFTVLRGKGAQVVAERLRQVLSDADATAAR